MRWLMRWSKESGYPPQPPNSRWQVNDTGNGLQNKMHWKSNMRMNEMINEMVTEKYLTLPTPKDRLQIQGGVLNWTKMRMMIQNVVW